MAGDHSLLKVAIGQIPIAMGDKRSNIAAVTSAILAAARERCDVIVLPECCLAGWLSPSARAFAEPIPGPFTRRLSALAGKHRLAIVVGMEEKDARGRIYNTAVLVDQHGTFLMHRKINELEIARATYSRGSSLNVVDLCGQPVGVNICADSWRPEITDALYLMGARIIFSPSAWAVEPGGEATNLTWITETYRQRVSNKELFIVAANGVGAVTEGPWRGRNLQGNSLAIAPDGTVLLCGPANEAAVLFVEIPLPKSSAPSGSS